MGGDALDEWRDASKSDIVAAFKYTHDAAIAELVCESLQVFRQPFIVKFIDCSILLAMDVVVLVSVKARRNENEIWFEFNNPLEHLGAKVFSPIR